jgi:2-dehydro-3-deoxyphosphogluconate aldolase/(4S)-4-hydroxy-2-oxoglutarate aldolase
MTKEELFAKIEEIGIIPAVRVTAPGDALFAAETVFQTGIPVVEITLTTPSAIDVISQLVHQHPDAIVGAGTVLDVDTARACLQAGATFLTSTGLDPELAEFARKNDISMIPGVLTPTEIMLARKAGAAFVKVFPCSSMGGPSYIRTLRRPFPDVRLIPAGGVTQTTASDYIRAGSAALGIGHDLLPQEAIRTRNADWIRELSHRFIGMVKHGRKELQHAK